MSTDHKAPHYAAFSTPITLSLIGPNILLSTLLSNTLSLRSSLNMSNQVAYTYTTKGKIIVLYILNFIFLVANWKTKDSALNNSQHSLTSLCS